MRCRMIETSSVLTQKFSVICEHFRQSSESVSELFGNVCLAFGQLSENLRISM